LGYHHVRKGNEHPKEAEAVGGQGPSASGLVRLIAAMARTRVKFTPAQLRRNAAGLRQRCPAREKAGNCW
jgi:hypothetical protein